MLTENKGDWTGLESETQRPRYNAIVRLVLEHCGNKAAVLDIGCGSGVLSTYLTHARGSAGSYMGVELSISAAMEARSKGTDLINSSAEAFRPQQQWDCIVLSEMLYYLRDPIQILKKYAAFVREGGVIIISIFQKREKPRHFDRFLSWAQPRRPRSNIHCSTMIERFFRDSAWPVLSLQEIAVPGTDVHWKIWAMRPPHYMAQV